MIFVIIFLACIGAIVAWWLSRQGLMTKPWLEQGIIDDATSSAGAPTPAPRVALGILIAVISSLFVLLFSAYVVRRDVPDWRSLSTPALVWINTAVLALSCVALQLAATAARRNEAGATKALLLAAGVSACAFLVGQVAIWRQLAAAGYFLASNPANSFFYLITGIHGLHLVGGLAALVHTAGRVRTSATPVFVQESVQLCATYWHFLLLVWMLFLLILTGWADEFAVLCRQLVSS